MLGIETASILCTKFVGTQVVWETVVISFVRGCLMMAPVWQFWILIMVLGNGVAPFFFLFEPVAMITVVSFCTGGLIASAMASSHGFTKLLGVMHGPWVPMVAFQVYVLAYQNPTGVFKTWLIASIVVSSVSIVLDAVDIVRYMMGERTDLLAENQTQQV